MKKSNIQILSNFRAPPIKLPPINLKLPLQIRWQSVSLRPDRRSMLSSRKSTGRRLGSSEIEAKNYGLESNKNKVLGALIFLRQWDSLTLFELEGRFNTKRMGELCQEVQYHETMFIKIYMCIYQQDCADGHERQPQLASSHSVQQQVTWIKTRKVAVFLRWANRIRTWVAHVMWEAVTSQIHQPPIPANNHGVLSTAKFAIQLAPKCPGNFTALTCYLWRAAAQDINVQMHLQPPAAKLH